MNLTYAQLLKSNRNFRNLLCGQFISELGNWFNFIAGLGLVRVVSEASPTAAGILFACRLLPFAVFSPIAGTFVDRFSRRTVMIVSDLTRVGFALMFLLVSSAENLWIAYVAMALLSTFGAFFDGAKNAATPNLTGKEGLLAGTALMFSTRFLLMAVGSALGGWAAVVFGYKIAFVINAASFLASAFSVWLIPEEATRENAETRRKENAEILESPALAGALPKIESDLKRASFIDELKEGLRYTIENRFALTILIMNVIWATGGGAINVIFERMGGVVFAGREKWNPDMAVALLWTASGFGLFAGMMIAHRVSTFLDRKNWNSPFIVWTLIVHGVLFAVAGYMPTLWLFMFFCFVSRAIVGVEYAVQETMFQRSLPDYIRGRISTLDRGAEMTIFGLSSYFSSEMMLYISPQMLTIISGILSASAGVVWFFRMRNAKALSFNREEVLSDA
ncbi:MAG TPA: MFS transporter [Pyrinomonadaceae bacterium]|nr:MFS transporter [Pyrinomonadaceae bacterium]